MSTSPDKSFTAQKILIFDADEFERSITQQLLRALDIERTVEEGDADAALDRLARQAPDIVVVGLSSDGAAALDFVRRLRVAEKLASRDVPILLLAHAPTEQQVIQARDLGVTEIALRPLSADTLAKRLRAMIVNPREFVDAESFVGPDRRRKSQSFAGGEDRRGQSQWQIDGGERKP